MLRRILLALVASTLLLAACGSDDSASTSDATTGSTSSGGDKDCPTSDALDAVEVTVEGDDKPEFTFDQPLSLDASACRVLEVGEGEEIADGSSVTFHFVFVNGRDGTELSSSYGQDPAEIVIDDELLAGVRLGLLGAKAGGQVLVAITPEDGFGPEGDDPQSGFKADDTMLFFADISDVRTPLERAEGKEVDPVEGQPTVTLDDDGAPTITVPDGEPPSELVAQLLIEGDGATVESGQSITVHYTGVLWDTGEVFDSSWESGTPATFPIGTGGVIPGWDKGLVGQTVGSQVLLVIPPADGYGEGGSGDTIPPGATLVFVVDILDAH